MGAVNQLFTAFLTLQGVWTKWSANKKLFYAQAWKRGIKVFYMWEIVLIIAHSIRATNATSYRYFWEHLNVSQQLNIKILQVNIGHAVFIPECNAFNSILIFASNPGF